jgi:hypothetical protein
MINAMYWFTPVFAFGLGAVLYSDDPWKNATLVATAWVFWWLLAMLTEENLEALKNG